MKINQASLTESELIIYQEALQMLSRNTNAIEFSSRFFGPRGRLSILGSDREERRKISKSDLYRWLQSKVAKLREEEAEIFEKEVNASSGRLTIAVPKSLHAALKKEAMNEGISLSELIRLKLSFSYRHVIAETLGSTRKRLVVGDR